MERVNKTSRKASYKYTRRSKITPPETRFWKFVNKDGPPPSHVPHLGKCWIWTGCSISTRDYGGFNDGTRKTAAHRFSYAMHNGIILKTEDCVLHKCDTPRCVRPDHLFLGDRFVNMQDCKNKGRMHFQIKPDTFMDAALDASRKFTDVQAFKLRRLRIKGVEIARMARWTGSHRGTIRHILSGRTYAHVPFPQSATDRF